MSYYINPDPEITNSFAATHKIVATPYETRNLSALKFVPANLNVIEPLLIVIVFDELELYITILSPAEKTPEGIDILAVVDTCFPTSFTDSVYVVEATI